MRASFRLMRIRGVVIGAHWSVPIVAALLVWSLADVLFPSAYPGREGSTYLTMGIATAVLYIGCLLLHELGHALRARQEDINVREITLWSLGGLTDLRRFPVSAAAEFRVAIAGPVVTAGLVVLFLALTVAGHALSLPDPLIGVMDCLVGINFLVLLFNLVPALPLDGGRVLRSWLWHRHNDLPSANQRAARVGQAFGLTLIALGLLASFIGSVIVGLWLVLLGWFLSQDARDALKQWRVRHPPLAGRSPQHGRGIPITTMIVISTVGVAALVYHPPCLVVSPGPSFNVASDVRIDGRPITPVNGEYLATTVRLSQPNLAQTVIAAARPDRDVIRLSSVLPRDVSPHDYARRQRAMYEESRRLAAAAAAQAVGLPVTVQGTGVRVSGTVRDTPAGELLRNGDVIIGVNGRRIGTMPELRHIVSAGPPGTKYVLTIERHGTRRQVTVRSVELAHITPATGLGLLGETRGLRVVLPFQIRFAERGDVGGPSAGLAYALAVADLLHRHDYASGRTIAATGTIDITGSIGQVSGVTQKTVAADRAGADLFVVPAAEVREARRFDDVPIHGTQNLEQALDIIAAA